MIVDGVPRTPLLSDCRLGPSVASVGWGRIFSGLKAVRFLDPSESVVLSVLHLDPVL